jgi:pimeloyl-ACP methyl ester carboxylesterase
MHEITHRFVETNGIRMHIAECGEGPLVLLLHGFPESWYSWRHQLPALAAQGFHAVAPDQRGYGQTDAPEDIAKYTQLHLVGDAVGLVHALSAETAIVAGHDWGAPVAWNCGLMRPDIFSGVAGLSVPYGPRGSMRPTDAMKAMAGENFFYILYFQEPGKAEAELQADVARTMRMFLYSASGDPQPGETFRQLPKTATFLQGMRDPGKPWAPWLTQEDLDFFTQEFSRAGFRGGLNWYRNVDRTWELLAPFHGAPMRQPAIFIAGDRDGVIRMNPRAVSELSKTVPNLRGTVMIPNVGHWTQQEAPEAVNAALIGFCKSVLFS